MPNLRSSTASGHHTGRQSALKLFTDREQERDLIIDFFSRLAWVGAQPMRPDLSSWGVGGIGKTSLLKKIIEEIGTDMPRLRFLTLDLDNDRGRFQQNRRKSDGNSRVLWRSSNGLLLFGTTTAFLFTMAQIAG